MTLSIIIMWNSDEIITGEKLQQLADVYLGDPSDFQYNPCIAQQSHKHQALHDLPTSMDLYSNPPIVFCYTHRLRALADKLDAFKNPFVLITHNSDDAVFVGNDPVVQRIASCLKMRRWFAQNVGGTTTDPKIVPLPIGMANRQWPHGDIDFFDNHTVLPPKTRDIYFHFNMQTNPTHRWACYTALATRVASAPPMEPTPYKQYLAQHRFCICPEGNGYDTHRLWEAWYLQVIPVVLYTPFMSQLLSSMSSSSKNLPIIVVNSWNDVQPETLNQALYENMTSRPDPFHHALLSFSAWSKTIKEALTNFP